MASAAGRALPPLAVASRTSRYWPGCRVPLSAATPLPEKLPVPVALPYCTDQPLTSTGLLLRLKSST